MTARTAPTFQAARTAAPSAASSSSFAVHSAQPKRCSSNAASSPGGSVNCTIAAADDFVVSRLAAPLSGVQRLDLVTDAGRFEDVPFDAAAGEVLMCPAPAELKRRSAFTHHVRLVSVDEAGERVLGEYTFLHTPS